MHNLPVATALHKHLPGAQIDWVVEEALVGIPGLHPAVGRVIPVALRRWRRRLFATQTWRELAAFRRELRRESYDLVLDTQGLIKSGLIACQARLTSTGERVGYAAETAREPVAARFYDRGIAIPRNMHAVERNLCLAAAACGMMPDTDVDYGIHSSTAQADWLPHAPYALLLTASSRDDKSWPRASWLALAASLTSSGLFLLLPAGTERERQEAAKLASAMGSRAMLAPELTLGEIAGLCAGARLVVGVDTGLTHLAAALGCPTLCLFAGSDPTLTGVYGGVHGGGAADARPAAGLARNLGSQGKPPAAAEACAVAAELLRQSAS